MTTFFFQKAFRRLALKLGVYIQRHESDIAAQTLPKFGNKPKNLRIDLPRRIQNPDRIFLGDDIWLGPGSLLMALTHYPGPSMRHPDKNLPISYFDSKITIGSRVSSTGELEIAAVSEITIEDDVLFASNIHINDSFHGYENANEPYKYQPIWKAAPIIIKKGSWIGQNVVILPGITIGELSIIGANSVVTKSIPDRSIAMGNPAKILKKWDEDTNRWVSVENVDGRDTISERWGDGKITELRGEESK